jgi:hypothetical protein
MINVFWDPKREACLLETSVNFYQTTRCHSTEYRTLHSYCCENLKSSIRTPQSYTMGVRAPCLVSPGNSNKFSSAQFVCQSKALIPSHTEVGTTCQRKSISVNLILVHLSPLQPLHLHESERIFNQCTKNGSPFRKLLYGIRYISHQIFWFWWQTEYPTGGIKSV